MNALQKLQTYGETHHPKWLDLLRIVLGVILVSKGLYYISNNDVLGNILKNSRFPMYSMIIVHYVAFAHLIGGILIIIGMVTRIAILFQIPILLGAIFFVESSEGILSTNSNLWFAILVLFLLIFFFIYGSGPWSADAILEKNKKDWDVKDI
ncbi:MAG: DoxX family membrane protein [Fimbriimonadaceae bacterium]|nr:DoxX family membrane protein [Chitinophagales bacterium]